MVIMDHVWGFSQENKSQINKYGKYNKAGRFNLKYNGHMIMLMAFGKLKWLHMCAKLIRL